MTGVRGPGGLFLLLPFSLFRLLFEAFGDYLSDFRPIWVFWFQFIIVED